MKKRPVRYCEQCGERLGEGDGFCRNCGAPVPAQTPKRRAPHPRKRTAGLVAAAVAAALVLAVAGGYLLTSRLRVSPVTGFLSSHASLFSQRVAEPLRSLEQLRTPGQLSADVRLSGTVDNDSLAPFLDSSSITLKANIGEDSALLGGEITLMGSTVLNGSLTYRDGRLGVCLPELDQHYYVMDLAPAVREATGQDPDLSAPLFPAVTLDQLSTTLGAYWDAVTALANEDNITAEENVSGALQVLPQEGTCLVYTFRPQAQSLETLILAVADLLEQEGGLRGLLREALGTVVSQLGPGAVKDAGNALDEALTQAAVLLRGSAASLADRLAQAGFAWSIAVQDDAVRQVKLSVLDAKKQTEEGVAYELAGSIGTELTETLYTFGPDGASTLLTHHRVCDGQAVSGEARFSTLSLTYDTEGGELSPLGLPYGTYALTGTDLCPSLTVRSGAESGTDYVLSLSGLHDATDGLFDCLELTANLVPDSTVQPPSAAPVDVTNYTDDQIQELLETMAAAFRNDLVANLLPLLRYVW